MHWCPRWLVSILTPLQCLLMCSAALGQPAAGSNGSSASNGPTRDVKLNGGVKDDERMRASLRVTPSGGDNSVHVQQFAAKATYHPGQAAPLPPPPPPVPKKPKIQPPKPVTDLPPEEAPVEKKVKPWTPPPPYTPPPPPKWNYSITPHDGIMSYSKQHSVTVVTPPGRPVVEQNLRGMLRSNTSRQAWFTHQTNGRRFQPPPVQPMMAVAEPVKSAHAASFSPITWDEWYHRVSSACYDQWSRQNVCAGDAVVHVSVSDSRGVDCQIAEFTPCSDVARDLPKEASFREAAIHSLYNLNRCEILDFPPGSTLQKVKFDMEFKRGVGGPAGCVVMPDPATKSKKFERKS